MRPITQSSTQSHPFAPRLHSQLSHLHLHRTAPQGTPRYLDLQPIAGNRQDLAIRHRRVTRSGGPTTGNQNGMKTE